MFANWRGLGVGSRLARYVHGVCMICNNRWKYMVDSALIGNQEIQSQIPEMLFSITTMYYHHNCGLSYAYG